jgi:hypothetical protein
VFIAMLITLLSTNRFTEPLDYTGPNLPPNQLAVYTPANYPGSSSGDTLPSSRQRQAGQATAATIAAALGTRNVLPLTSAVAPTDTALQQVGVGGARERSTSTSPRRRCCGTTGSRRVRSAPARCC